MHSELRIHGVSGTPPRDMLYTDPVTESTADDYTKIYRVPGTNEGYDPDAGAFHWGGLTAGSWHTAFWILLAPFALANVAGWLVAKRNRGTVLGVRLAGLALTALFSSQLLSAAVVVHAWLQRQALPAWAFRPATVVLFGALVALVFWITGLLSIRSHFTPLDFWCRVRLLLWPSRDWLQQPAAGGDDCEPERSDDWSDPAFANLHSKEPWVADERVWLPHSITHRTRRCHFAVGVTIVSIGLTLAMNLPGWVYWSGIAMLGTAVLILALTTLNSEPRWIVVLTAWLSPAAFALAVVITSLTAYYDLPRLWQDVHSMNLAISIGFGAASVLALAFGAGRAVGALALAAFFGGAMGIAAVTVLERLTSTPGSLDMPEDLTDSTRTYLGNGAGWVAVWMLVVVLVLVFVASFLSLIPVDPEPDPRPKTPQSRQRLMLVRLRRVIYRAHVILWSVIVVGLAAAVGLALFLCETECAASNLEVELWGPVQYLVVAAVIALGVALWPLGGLIRFAVPIATVVVVAASRLGFLELTVFKVPVDLTGLVDASLTIAVLIPALWIFTSIFGGVRDGEKRRKTGLLWDVASFWPRYFHPLSPPPYGPNAVHELMKEVTGESLILSAHSQGSVVAAVALSQLDETQAARIKRVITYGSPLQLIYSRLFAQSGLEQLVKNKAGIDHLIWCNLWRRSDYLGGLKIPLPDGGSVNFEADGLGHSGYECTRQFRQLKNGIKPVDPGDESVKCGARPI